MDSKIYYKLKEKAKLVEWNNETRKEKYILFSVNGYTEELKKLAKTKEDLILAEQSGFSTI